MEKIRAPETVAEEIRDLESIVKFIKELLKQYSADSASILALEQAEYRKSVLQSSVNQVGVLKRKQEDGHELF